MFVGVLKSLRKRTKNIVLYHISNRIVYIDKDWPNCEYYTNDLKKDHLYCQWLIIIIQSMMNINCLQY